MKNKVKKFQLEELEQRFEMGWGVSPKLEGVHDPKGNFGEKATSVHIQVIMNL